MHKIFLLSSLTLSFACLSLLCNTAQAETSTKQHSREIPCGDSCQSSRISARHIENKGIGYKTGYTTLEAFIAAPVNWSVMPFLDLRGHIFNNGHWAANGGIGIRSLQSERIYGGYAYYDFRDSSHRSYNQISFGLETLGTFWDLRLNGYTVIGSKKSHPYDPKFSRFGGNTIYATEKYEYALSGGNGEIGFYPLKMQDATLYTGIGPYYLIGPIGTGVWGGQTRIKAMWKDYVGVEVTYSYDHVFKNNIQGEFTLSLPLGAKAKVKEKKERKCIDSYLLCQRITEPVVKNEIIPLNTKRKETPAINPDTDQPYTIWFVDNTSNSLGTFESPFSNLADAENASGPNDVLYLYPGDLTSSHQSSGITLKNNQQFYGSCINHDLATTTGTIVLNAQTPGINPPVITNEEGPVVTLANNNIVSGFYIQNTSGAGIYANGSNNAFFNNNYIQGSGTAFNGVELDNTSGTISGDLNTIITQQACVNILNSDPISNTSYLFTENTFHSEDGNYGVNLAYTEGANNYFLSRNNNFYGSESAGVNISCTNTTANTPHVFNISNCTFGTYSNYAVELILNNDSVANLNINDSLINSYYGAYLITYNQSQLTTKITNNTWNVYDYAFYPASYGSSTINTTFTNNNMNCYDYPIYIYTNDNSRVDLDVRNNNLSCYEYGIETDMYGASTVSGTFKNNNINSLYYGIYTYTANSSKFEADITKNVISSSYYHIENETIDSSIYSGDITKNTFIGQDNDDTINWSINTAGSVDSLIARNVFTGNYDALFLSIENTGSVALDISNNIVQNSSTRGMYINNNGTNTTVAVTGNTFQGFGTNAVNVSNTGGTMCLKLNENNSMPFSNAYLVNRSGGTLNFITPHINNGQITETGTINEVSQCP